MLTALTSISSRASIPRFVAPSLLEKAISSVVSAIYITDATGTIVWVNQAFTQLCGYSAEEIVGQRPAILKSGKHNREFYADLWQSITSGKVWQGEVVDQRKCGAFYTVDETITPLFDEGGEITHFVAVQHDITQRKYHSEQERHLAYHDMLTGLPNRTNFLSKLQQAIHGAARKQQQLALLFLDLDKFKPVNDLLGHAVGDRVLTAVAGRLASSVRRTDVVARFGGDEFAILLSDGANLALAMALAEKLLGALTRPFMLGKQAISISASIGIALYPDDGLEPGVLLANTDAAMYRAKRRGGHAFQFFRV